MKGVGAVRNPCSVWFGKHRVGAFCASTGASASTPVGAEGSTLVAVLGDFNETPDGAPLKPLLKDGSDLVDVMVHPAFVGDGRPGTHGNGTGSGKLDYILMSPALAARVTADGVERRGVWGGKNGTLFPHLPEITKEIEAASDHAALFVDFA